MAVVLSLSLSLFLFVFLSLFPLYFIHAKSLELCISRKCGHVSCSFGGSSDANTAENTFCNGSLLLKYNSHKITTQA